MKHDEKPQLTNKPTVGLSDTIKRRQDSDYYQYVQTLLPAIRGKVVLASQAGTSGFLLFFEDGSWVASYLDADSLHYEVGNDVPPEQVVARLNSSDYGDARLPLTVRLPYASQPCDLASEVAKSHGKPVTGIAFGARCFNCCFPGGWELDTWIVPDPNGKTALRVFFEQW